MSKILGMPRADARGFRYKPREIWDEDEKLKRELENIGTVTGDITEKMAGAINDLGDYVSESIEALSFPDEKAKVFEGDPVPAFLNTKILAGNGITIDIGATPGYGHHLTIGLSQDVLDRMMIVCVHDFNTNIKTDTDGITKIPRVGDERLIETFDHPIDNEHYLFEIYRPTEDRDSNPTDRWSDGTIRGRYQIRWQNVEQKKANRFSIRFHQPEYGTIVLYGCRSVFRV